MNYYNEIKNKLIDNEVYKRVKDYSKERNTVITYFEMVDYLLYLGENMEIMLLMSIQKN